MKKLLVLVLTIFLANQLHAQLTGSYKGQNDDTWMINWDYTAGADANLRLSTKTSNIKRSWNIFHESSNNNLYFTFSNNTHDPQHIGFYRMVLTDPGNLGIGTTSPTQKLDVRGNTYVSGSIGIGTSGPTYKLHAKGDVYADGGWVRVSGQRGIYFQSYGGGFYMTDDTWIRTYNNKSFYHNSGTMRTDGTFQVGSGGSRFLVKTDGKVGIGTTSPGYKLDVSGDIRANNGWIRSQGDYGLYNNSDGTYFYSDDANYWRLRSDRGLRVDNRAGTRKGYLYHDNGDGFGLLDGDGNWGLRLQRDSYTSFHINNSEKMRILSSGSVGIGTTSPTAKLHLRGSRADFYIQNTSATNWAFMRIQGSGSNFWDIGQYGDNDYLEFRPKGASNGNRVVIKQSGHVGIGTTSPDHKLSVIGKLSLVNTDDETIDYIRLYHDTQANLSTEEGSLHFRKDSTEYFVVEQLAENVSRIHSSGKALSIRARAIPDVPDPADPAGDLTIKDDGTVVVERGLEINSGGNLQINNVATDNNYDYVLALDSGRIAKRSVTSLTPWVIREIYHEADTINMFTCDPHAEGEECTCLPGMHISIDSTSIVDIQGNLVLGEQGFIDNDDDAGPNNDSPGVLSDDYLRIQEFVEISSSDSTRGLVLKDVIESSNDFFNISHNGGVSYFSNSTVSAPRADYFMKAGTGVPAEKNQITFADRVTFNNGFVTSSYISPNAMNFAMDTDNTGADAIFKVGRGTQNVNDETNWFGLFYVDKDGVATFSSDIGDTSNPNRIILNGGTGSGSFSSDLTVEGVSNLSGNLNVGGSSVFSLSADFLQDVNVTGNLNVLGSSNILTGSYGSAVDWKTAYDSRVNANQGLLWDPVSKNLDVKLGDGLHLNGSGEIESDFVQDGPNEISYHGSLAIGTTKHSTFALSVAGEVGAEEVTIQNEGEWPDYVFEAGYQLESLEETAAFIAKNKHLPEVPSAQEVSENGIKVGQMNAILLKKIEELTLHLIAKDKEIASLREENKRIDDIEERLLQLENK